MFWFSFLVAVLIKLSVFYIILENLNTLVRRCKVHVIVPLAQVIPGYEAKRTDVWAEVEGKGIGRGIISTCKTQNIPHSFKLSMLLIRLTSKIGTSQPGSCCRKLTEIWKATCRFWRQLTLSGSSHS
jgi:hypothetical protein